MIERLEDMRDDWNADTRNYGYLDDGDRKGDSQSLNADDEASTSKVKKETTGYSYCPACGKRVSNDADECIHCGRSLKEKGTRLLYALMWSFILIGEFMIFLGIFLYELPSDGFNVIFASHILIFIGSLLHLGYIPCGVFLIRNSHDKVKDITTVVLLGVLTLMALTLGITNLYLLILFIPINDVFNDASLILSILLSI